ncbi:MAG: F0F1 ATP synthase subunit B [Patescibacteria group bacterium]
MDSLISTFHIDFKLMIAQLFNFALVFVCLYFIAAKPLRKLIGERDEEIKKGLADAKTNAEMLENTAKESEAAMRKARTEANEIFDKAKKEVEKKKTEMLESAQKEVASMLAQGKKTLDSEREKMLNEVKNEVAGLVISATEKILVEKNK